MSGGILEELRHAILNLNRTEAISITKKAILEGVAPLEIVEGGLRPSLEKIGEEFDAARIFLPELVAAGVIADEVGRLIEGSHTGGEERPSKGSIALGTVKGDIHSVGKNIVAIMMRANGFRVIDLGTDVSSEEFVRLAPAVDAVGLSGLLTTATGGMEKTIKEISSVDPGKVIIAGGASMNPELARALGVLYGPDAASGVRLLNEALKIRR